MPKVFCNLSELVISSGLDASCRAMGGFTPETSRPLRPTADKTPRYSERPSFPSLASFFCNSMSHGFWVCLVLWLVHLPARLQPHSRPYRFLKDGRGGGTRTHNPKRRILSPLRMPIPPRPHKSMRPLFRELAAMLSQPRFHHCIAAPPQLKPSARHYTPKSGGAPARKGARSSRFRASRLRRCTGHPTA